MNSFNMSSTWAMGIHSQTLHSIQVGEFQPHYSQYHQLQSRIGFNVTEHGTFIFPLLFSPPLHTLEFQCLRQPGAVSILNSGSVSPAGERICKTKRVFLLPAAKRDRFSQVKRGSASQHITLRSRNLPLVMARRGAFAAALGAGGRGEEEESSKSEHPLHRAGEQQFQGFNGGRGKKEAKCGNESLGAEAK